MLPIAIHELAGHLKIWTTDQKVESWMFSDSDNFFEMTKEDWLWPPSFWSNVSSRKPHLRRLANTCHPGRRELP